MLQILNFFATNRPLRQIVACCGGFSAAKDMVGRAIPICIKNASCNFPADDDADFRKRDVYTYICIYVRGVYLGRDECLHYH